MNTDQQIIFIQKKIQELQDELKVLINEKENKIKLERENKITNLILKFLNKYTIITKNQYKCLNKSRKEKSRIKKTALYDMFKIDNPYISSKFFHKVLNNNNVIIVQNGGFPHYILPDFDIKEKCPKCNANIHDFTHTLEICNIRSSFV